MPKLSLSVRVAAASIVFLSLLHIIFWASLALTARSGDSSEFPYNYLFAALCIFSAAGLPGIVVGVGLFRSKNWARVAALVLSVLAGCFSALSVLVLFIVSFGTLSLGLGVEIPQKSDLLRVGVIYVLIFAIAVWWLIVFSRKSVAAQFSRPGRAKPEDAPKKSACPPPIALLAWLMIISSALSAASWPLILGRIPAMLFTHIFSPGPSRLIWLANILVFAVCGVGLLKLRRSSYDSTIALHLFWLISLLTTQLSSNYQAYTLHCLKLLDLGETYPVLNRIHFPQWVSATTIAIPTALLIAGLFYYRRSFLQAVQTSRHSS
jgi:hypothetical protein